MYFFFFNDTATTEIYTLSLHDALPISLRVHCRAIPRQAAGNVRGSARRCRALRGGVRGLRVRAATECGGNPQALSVLWRDRKSTRLNSSHANISYAVFCLKKKKTELVK